MSTISTAVPAEVEPIDPSTGAPLGRVRLHSSGEIDRAIAQAVEAQRSWAQRPVAERASQMKRLGTHLRENSRRYGETITSEMGKPITEAIAEVEKCAWACEYYAENGPRFLADEEIASNAARSLVAYAPLGVVLAIMPWNYPFWQALRFASAALTAGNAALLKHASNVPQSALAIQSAFEEAGFPPGVIPDPPNRPA